MPEFYIICKRHMFRKDHAVLFWGPDRSGYRYNIADAGIYTLEEAAKFPESHYNHDKPVNRELVDKVAVESVIDNRILGRICLNNKSNRELLGIKLTELHTGDTAWNSRAFCDPKMFLKQNENTLHLIEKIKKGK